MPLPTIFVSYSHKDKSWKDRLVTQLGVLESRAMLSVWDDRKIAAGEPWKQKLSEAIDAASVAILLISASFLASEFIKEEEIPHILSRNRIGKLQLFPIIVSPVAWEGVEWLRSLQLRPIDGNPLSSMNKSAAEAHLAGVAREIGLRPVSAKGIDAIGPVDISVARLRTTDTGVVGREKELGLLNRYWEDPNTNVVSVVGFAGCGKSALVYQWLINMGLENFRGAERVYGWTFDGQRSAAICDGRRNEDDRSGSADDFIDTALGWFGYNSPTINSLWDKGERLAQLFRRFRTLLILDGLESLQHPIGLGNEGTLIDSALRVLLSELAASNSGLCVVTTRAPVADIAGRAESTAPLIALQQLPEPSAILFLKRLGVKGNEAELKAAVNEVQCHALTLRLLGTYLKYVCGGDVSQRSLVGMSQHQSVEVVARQVVEAYERWFGEGDEVAILRILGLFDEPAIPRALEALSNPPPIPPLTEALPRVPKWRTAVLRLRDCGLLAPPNTDDPDTLDAHPLVKVHFRERLRENFPEAWQKGNERLYLFLRESVDQLPDRLQPLLRLYAAISHGCRANQHQDALDAVYKQRISRGENFARNKLGAVSSDLRALESFIHEPWTIASPNLNSKDQAFVLSNVGLVLKILGRTSEAVEALQAARKQYLGVGDAQGAAVATRHLSLIRMLQGNLTEAFDLLRSLEQSASPITPTFEHLATSAILGDLCYKRGDWELAWHYFRLAEDLQKRLDPEAPALYSVQGYKYCEFLLALGYVADARERAVELAKWPRQQKYMVAVALNNLLLGKVHIAQSDRSGTVIADEADLYIEKGLEGLRCAGEVEQIAVGLLTRAELFRRRGSFLQARKDLGEAEEIIRRAGIRLYLPDLHLALARVHLAESGPGPGNTHASEHLRMARELVEEMHYTSMGDLILDIEESRQSAPNSIERDEGRQISDLGSISPPGVLITNDKLIDMSPRWAPFRGFSLLFDNLTRPLTHEDALPNLPHGLDTTNGALYQAFSDSLIEIGEPFLTKTFLLCLLPPSTYHVTIWNGVNDANVPARPSDPSHDLKLLLEHLPSSLAADNPIWAVIQGAPLVNRKGWTIDFVLDKLAIWHDRVLVARLKPADRRSRLLLSQLLSEAKDLSESVGRVVGLDLPYRLNPHVTLGYYANEGGAQTSLHELERWNVVFARNAGATTVTFSSLGLYGFTDMVSFFRRPDA